MSKTKETDPALAAIGKGPSGDKKDKSLEEWSTEKEFIYGGPFVKQETPSPLLGTATPINLQLQGTFKKSFAYYSLKERMPVILTKVIDYCSREGAKIKSATGGSDEDLRNFIQYVTKLKNDLVTNKKYDLLTVDTPEAKRWNEWIQNAQNSYYFTNTWVFTECYIYRRLREGAELQKGLQTFDPFDEQKEKAFKSCMEPMCIVAEKVAAMLPESDKDKKKADFMTLVKICLWANKCDLSLSMGEQVNLKGETASAAKKDAATNTGDSAKATADSAKATADSAKATADSTKATADAKPTAEPSKDSKGSASATDKSATPNTAVMDPIQMIVDYKDKVLVDDSGKAFDAITAKAETMAKAIEGSKPADAAAEPSKASTGSSPPTSSPPTSSSPPTTTSAATPGSPAAEEAPKIPCPAKMVLPQSVIYDIVCDNAGYELFADLCLAHFLIAQKIVQKVRFHVKKIPWFVSDVTPRDFKYVIAQCRAASFNREVPAEPKPDAAPDAPPEPPRVIGSSSLKTLADQWQAYVDDGTFIVMSDDFWTSPHVFKDMKQYDYNLYRKLQYAVGIMFKGDLNYRKLLGERNCNPTLGFEPALQGFIPAPILAVRTVKADLICALPKGRFEQLNKLDEKWMQKGDYGVISFCGKAEPLKVSDRPCLDYGDKCFSVVCPIHKDM